MSPVVPPRGVAPRRSMWSSAMMPFSMSATRVSAMSQEMTRMFLAIRSGAFPPGAGCLQATRGAHRGHRLGDADGTNVETRRVDDDHPRRAHASRNRATDCLGRRRDTL